MENIEVMAELIEIDTTLEIEEEAQEIVEEEKGL